MSNKEKTTEELQQEIKDLRNLLNEKRNTIKTLSQEVTYFTGLFKEQKNHNKVLKNRLLEKDKEIAFLNESVSNGYKQSDTFSIEHSGVYRIYNKMTGESYVGQSSVDVYKRCMSHFKPAKYNEEDWHYDLIEHPDDYEYEIIVEGVRNQGDLDRLEIYNIGKYKAYDEGYNKALMGKYKFLSTYGKDEKIEQLE